MTKVNYRKIYAIKEKNKQLILKHNPYTPEKSGIYILTRIDEQGFRFAYIGQAKNILQRLADHLSGYQHIDLSLKKHGLAGEENAYGWRVDFKIFTAEELDTKEQEYIKEYADNGYQLRNKTTGSQGTGKKDIEDRVVGGYRKGVDFGYNKAIKEISTLMERFDYVLIPKTNKNGTINSNSKKAIDKLKELIGE